MGKYDDLLDHPHYQSKKRPHMSMTDRAAQFSPFAALTGYGDKVAEAEMEMGSEEKKMSSETFDDYFFEEMQGKSAPFDPVD